MSLMSSGKSSSEMSSSLTSSSDSSDLVSDFVLGLGILFTAVYLGLSGGALSDLRIDELDPRVSSSGVSIRYLEGREVELLPRSVDGPSPRRDESCGDPSLDRDRSRIILSGLRVDGLDRGSSRERERSLLSSGSSPPRSSSGGGSSFLTLTGGSDLSRERDLSLLGLSDDGGTGLSGSE